MSDVALLCGDCLTEMARMDANSVDTCITDPPYELAFMGKTWDRAGVAFSVDTWAAVLRVMKPGGTLLAFGGDRTHHRLMCAIEDAGFELRTCCYWVFGSGFPKSLDISKAIDKAAGAEREVVGENGYASRRPHKEYDHMQKWGSTLGGSDTALITAPSTPLARLWEGWGTALKPAAEIIVVAMKPLEGTFAANAIKYGVAGLWIEGGRIPTSDADRQAAAKSTRGPVAGKGYVGDFGLRCNYEPVVYHPAGRWPATLIHDGSDEVLAGFPETGGAHGGNGQFRQHTWMNGDTSQNIVPDTTGSAARFFYCAKASRAEREAGLEGMEEHKPAAIYGDGMNGPTRFDPALHTPEGVAARQSHSIVNHHPTVKPLSLMRYLARLTMTPTGGLVLDPFMGSGTTGCACVLEGRPFVGCELSPEYFEIARRRIEHARFQMIMPLPVAEAAS